MKHLSEEEMVEQYCGGVLETGAQLHLAECEECATAFARLETDLATVRTMEVPERDAAYGERMWARVAERLPMESPRENAPARKRFWEVALGRGLVYAAAGAALVAGAFYLGRVWEHGHAPRTEAKSMPAPAQQHVVVVVLGDHLDRSERLLVELKHAGADDAESVSPLKDEARNLLAANHVFRADAEKSGDAELSEALDHLDRLLTEMANQPGGMNAAAIARLQDEMNTDGLLFDVRVLRSRHPHRDATARVVAKGGTA